MGKAKFLLLQRRIYNLKMIIRKQKYKINYHLILKHQKDKLSPQRSNEKTYKQSYEKRLNPKASQIIKDFLVTLIWIHTLVLILWNPNYFIWDFPKDQ